MSKALVLEGQEKISIRDVPTPTVKEGHVLVRMHAAALNRRDYWCYLGKYGSLPLKIPSILGSDGCGVVEEIGAGVPETWLHKEVILNPGSEWGNNERVQSANYHALGMPGDGTFATHLLIPADRLHHKPQHLTSAQAAALPLAGLTAYRAAFVQGQLKPGQKVLVTGVGSGVSSFIAQFAAAAGAEVWVTSSSNKKIENAVKLFNVKGGVNYKDKGWIESLLEKAGGTFDLILDGAGGPEFGDIIVKLLGGGGILVNNGVTVGEPNQFPLRNMMFMQKQVIGTCMGSDKDFQELLEFVSSRKLVPLVDSVQPFESITTLIPQMGKGEHMGKLVISFDHLLPTKS